MHSIPQRAAALLFCLALSLPSAAQDILSSSPAEKSPATATHSAVTDPLGRETPSGCIFGFLQAAQSGNYKAASKYLQLTVTERRTGGAELSEQLKVVMDHGFVGNLKRISTSPEGTLQDGLPLDREKAGTLAIGDLETDLLLTQVLDPEEGRVWLISSETLAKVPDLYAEVQVSQLESHLPQVLVERQFLGMPPWQWLAILLAIPVSALLGWLLVKVFLLPRLAWAQYRKQSLAGQRNGVSGPLWLIASTLIDMVLTRLIGIPLLRRHYFLIIVSVVLIVGFTWLLLRLSARLMQRLRERTVSSGRWGAGSVLLLGERILKALIIVFAAFGILSSLGFNMTTALAGVGIGGLAIAFAAQKTLENLFGGISVLGDEVIRIGDHCQFGDRVGRIEDISLRSTRIRTVERTELSIPNGALATMNVENLSRRDKMLFKTKFGLRSETSADQLRYVLAELRRMLYEHPKVESQDARIRFVEFQESALGIELFCYILTRDTPEFNAIREDVLFRIMQIVEQAGTGLAFPSRTVYMTRDPGLDNARTEEALQRVEKWREEKQLPFPDFTATDIAEFQGTLPYPEPDSAVARRVSKD
jgi:MscS family membrane protein